MIGSILVKVTFVLSILMLAGYFEHIRRPQERLLRVARGFFHGTVVGVLVISATLLYLILTHQFQYTYIWSYSSRDLSTPLLISTFYAGQEGSFTLWLLFSSIIGIFLLQYSIRKGYEPEVMASYGLILFMLLFMIVVKSPFTYVWETWEGEVEPGFVPPQGRGLNPLLMNYWMVIHPQVLFSGFAAMGVPFSFALAGLMKKEYTTWIRPATPWIVFGSLALGTGIILGGFWAYETLGWGGYWAWDPVENSSLVPWLFSIALMHTILAQRKSGQFIRTNVVLAILCFVSVMYSTFLTRSGVLGETSVHSFVDPGMDVYRLLIGFLILFTSLGLGLLLYRLKDMPKTQMLRSFYSKEFALFLGSVALVFGATYITLGTSSPVITEILRDTKAAVEITFYSKTAIWLGVAIAFLVGVGQLMWWTRAEQSTLIRRLRIPSALALVATIVLYVLGVHQPDILLFLFATSFALVANIQVGIRIMGGNPKFAGGAIGHVGLAIMFFGFVATSEYDAKQTLSLTQGKPVDALGYVLTFNGYRPTENEKYAFNVKVEKDGRSFTAHPVMYYSEFNKGIVRNPDIINLRTKDFYIAPLSLESAAEAAKKAATDLTIKKGETQSIGSLDITFLEFDLPVNQRESMLEGGEAKIGAKILVKEYGGKGEMIVPAQIVQQGQVTAVPATFKDRFDFSIAGMSPDQDIPGNSTVTISVLDRMLAKSREAEGDILVVEASVKPLINLVWAGFIILIVGLVVTIVRRAAEARWKPSAGSNGDLSQMHSDSMLEHEDTPGPGRVPQTQQREKTRGKVSP